MNIYFWGGFYQFFVALHSPVTGHSWPKSPKKPKPMPQRGASPLQYQKAITIKCDCHISMDSIDIHEIH